MQAFFRFVTYALIAALVYMICLDYLVYHDQHKTKPATLTDLPEFKQICWVPIISAFALFALKRQIQNASRPIFKHITKDQEDKEVWQARIERSSTYIFKLAYYTGSSIWAYWLFSQTDFLPTWMGGSGSLRNHFTSFPYKPQVPGLLSYSLF